MYIFEGFILFIVIILSKTGRYGREREREREGRTCSKEPQAGIKPGSLRSGPGLNGTRSTPSHVTPPHGRRTHQAVDHLVEHGPQTPPVHGAVVRLLAQHLRSQVLLGGRDAWGDMERREITTGPGDNNQEGHAHQTHQRAVLPQVCHLFTGRCILFGFV